MTTEQAIKLLHRLQDEQFDGEYGDERREALEMAVRALEGDGDTIYRQDAIDACCFGITHARVINVETGVAVDLFTESNKELHKAIERIEALPSAQPKVAKDTNVPNNDCISRQAAMVVFENSGLDDDSKDTVVRVLEQLPSAQPERDIPVKPIETTDKAWGIPKRQAVCPNCDYYLGHVAFLGDYKGKRVTYCETCGQAIDWEGWNFDE